MHTAMEYHPMLFATQPSSSSTTHKSYHFMGTATAAGTTSHDHHSSFVGELSNSKDGGGESSSAAARRPAGDHDADRRSPGGGVVTGKKKGETKKERRPRYAFQTRSQVDILDDGYRWRKYGQKAVKNNKYPRSYYRCTHQGCNVKKQVQRLSKDEGLVVTTYEGTHTHPIEKSNDNFEHILTQMQIYSGIGGSGFSSGPMFT